MLADFLRCKAGEGKCVDIAVQGEGEQGEGIGTKKSGRGAGVIGVVARAKRRRPLWVRTRVT